MDIGSHAYFKTCKTMLEILGLWPYQNHLRRIISHIAYYLISFTICIPQIILLTHEKNLNVIIELIATVALNWYSFMKYSVTFVSAPKFKLLFTKIANDWKIITNEKELSILHKYGEEGRYATLIYSFYLFAGYAGYFAISFVPIIPNILFPKENSSYHIVPPFYADYVFFNINDHIFLATCHAFFVYFFVACLFAGADGAFIITAKHICGSFALISYRLESLINFKDEFQESTDIELKSDEVVCRHLIRTINLQNECVICCKLFQDSFNLVLLQVQSLCTIFLAVLAFYIVSIYADFYVFLRALSFTIGVLVHLFWMNIMGQFILDESERVFTSVYFSHWYLCSSKARKLIRIIMLRSLYPYKLTAGNLFDLSIKAYGNIIKTAISYFTVILAVSG